MVPQRAPTFPAASGGLIAARSLARRVDFDELLDQDGHDPRDLAANFQDIQTVNRLAGGTATVLHHLPDLVGRAPHGRPVEILDLATGAGDIPRAVIAWGQRHARPLHVTASDASPAILDIARQTLVHLPGVSFALADARDVPFPDRAFDIVLCSLTLHHFAPPRAIQVLREMDRLSRTGFILNDIRRCATGYLAAWTSSRLATRNHLTRHDMPLSVRRAYTPEEVRGLLEEAGIPHVTVTTHPLFRMAAVQRKPAS